MATPAALARWRRQRTQVDVLVEVTLTPAAGGTARVLTLASAEAQTPAGAARGATLWANAIGSCEDIVARGDFVANDVNLVATAFTIPRQRLAFQAAGETTLDLLRQYRWDESAIVSIYLWERGATSFDDAIPQLVQAAIVQPPKVTGMEIEVQVRQRTDWNAAVRVPRVTRSAYPRAPEANVGAAIPVLIGSLRPPPMRPPFGAPYNVNQRVRELLTGGVRVARSVLVDAGRGAGVNPARVLVASHAVKQLGANNPDYGTPVWLESNGVLQNIDVAGGNIFLAAADGAGFTMDDGANVAVVGVLPIDVEAVSNNANDPRNALDAHNETTFARLDYAALQRTLRVRFPSISVPGTMTEVIAYILYRTSASAPGARLTIQNTEVGGFPATFVNLTASIIPAYVGVSLGTAWGTGALPNDPWNLGELVGIVDFSGSGSPSGTIHVFGLGLVAIARPDQVLIESERVVRVTRTLPHARTLPFRVRRRSVEVNEVQPAITELVGKFYANVDGYPDNGSGDYTGTAAALVERPCDVAQLMLNAYAGQALGKIERGGGTFGSFVDARSLLKTWRQGDMKLAGKIGDDTDMRSVLAWLADASCSWIYLDRFSDKWKLVPWRPDTAANYPWTFSREHILEAHGPEVSGLDSGDVVSGVRVLYGWDEATDSFLHECYATKDGSSAGYLYRNLRFATTTVSPGVNDKVDFRSNGVTRVATLTAIATTPAARAQDCALKMDVADPSLAYGGGECGTIVLNYNDQISVIDIGVPRTVTRTPGKYTMEALAAHDQEILNAGSSGWTVTYSRTTRKFTYSHATHPGTGLVVSAASTRALRGWMAVGFNPNIPDSLPTAFPAQGQGERDDDFLWLGCYGGGAVQTFELLAFSGTNGPNGTKQGAHEVMGYDMNEDLAASWTFLSQCPRFQLEDNFKSASDPMSTARNGEKRPLVIEARFIYDTDTALELLVRLATLLGKRRRVVEFHTEFAPDVERGKVIAFDATLNEVMPYPDPDSDGSWVGKRFAVIEVGQSMGPVSFATRIKAVSLG